MEHPQTESEWRGQAFCLGLDHDMFFPKRGESTKVSKGICGSCEVQAECLEDAIMRKEIAGIRGGKSKRERDKIAKERGMKLSPQPRLYNGNHAKGFS